MSASLEEAGNGRKPIVRADARPNNPQQAAEAEPPERLFFKTTPTDANQGKKEVRRPSFDFEAQLGMSQQR